MIDFVLYILLWSDVSRNVTASDDYSSKGLCFVPCFQMFSLMSHLDHCPLLVRAFWCNLNEVSMKYF